jgi:hypothetical protein
LIQDSHCQLSNSTAAAIPSWNLLFLQKFMKQQCFGSDSHSCRLLLCRDLGPESTQGRFFFGHSAAAPKGQVDIALDVERDIAADNIIAILMADCDAEVWGRRFDIVLVNKVTTSKRQKTFKVQYYNLEGVQPGQHELDTLEFQDSEKAAVEGMWKLTDQANEVSPDSTLCLSWVQGDGKIHPEYKHYLREALLDIDSL